MSIDCDDMHSMGACHDPMESYRKFTLEIGPADGLQGENWSFYWIDDKLAVRSYSRWSRASERHEREVTASWSSINMFPSESDIAQKDVPLTREVEKKAKKAWLKMLDKRVRVSFQFPA